MGSSICTNKHKNQVVVPIPTNQNNEDFSDEDEIITQYYSEESGYVLELFIKCTNLVTENRFQLINSVAFVYILQGSEYVKKVETEIQTSTLAPLFNKSVKINYCLGSTLNIKIEIWEVGNKKEIKTLLGSSIYNIHEIAARNDIIYKELEVQGKRNGSLLIWAKELKQYNDVISMQWEFESKIFTKGFFLLRLVRAGGLKPIIIYQSESKKPPVFWEKFQVTVNRICQGNEERIIKAEILHIESEMTIVATAYITVKQMKNETCLEYPTSLNQVINGTLKLTKFNYESKMSFIDFIRSGLKIHPFYAIDFSEKINHSENLEENPYLNCIKDLQNILQFYSQDPLYPVLGTGCYFPTISIPSYCFALNGNFFQPEIASHVILKDYYQTTLNSTTPSNITNFAELLDIVIKYIQHEQVDSQKYYALFIISPSEPTDLREMHKLYPIITNLPLSVFILKIDHETPRYELLDCIIPNEKRDFFSVLAADEVENTLDKLKSQLITCAKYMDIDVAKKYDHFRQRSNSLIKNFSEKIRSRSNYFTKTKSDYIEHLTKAGYSALKIEEISLIGVPFLIMTQNSSIRLPVRTRTKIMGLRNKSMRPADLTCGNCNKAVFILAESKCGCKTFCYECVNTSECLNC